MYGPKKNWRSRWDDFEGPGAGSPDPPIPWPPIQWPPARRGSPSADLRPKAQILEPSDRHGFRLIMVVVGKHFTFLLIVV